MADWEHYRESSRATARVSADHSPPGNGNQLCSYLHQGDRKGPIPTSSTAPALTMTTRRCDHCKSGILYLHQGDRKDLVGVTVRMIEFGLVPPPGRPQGSHPHFILSSRPYNG